QRCIETVYHHICTYFPPLYLTLRLQGKMNPHRESLTPTRLYDMGNRFFKIRMIVFLGQSHAHGKVMWTNKNGIESHHIQKGIQIVQSRYTFNVRNSNISAVVTG